MERSIKEACEQYEEQFSGDKDELSVSDYVQVKDIVLETIGNERSINLFLYTATDTALKAGFMIGYHAAMKEAKALQG